MLDIAATTSASIHALTGSSRPGTVPPFSPVATASASSRPVIEAFAASADAAVIELAGRVKALAHRDHRIWDRLSAIEDAVAEELPQSPRRPEQPAYGKVSEVEVNGVRTTTFSTLTTPGAEHQAALSAYEAAVAELARQDAEVKARLGHPFWEKLSRRTFRRLVRWTEQLTALEPVSQAGLAAKAGALLAVQETGNLDRWVTNLAVAVSRDAVRIATALASSPSQDAPRPVGSQTEIRAHQDAVRDSDLFQRARRWQDADLEHREAEAEMEASWHRYLAVAPAEPEELFVSEQDHRRVKPYVRRHSSGRMWYGDADTRQMLREGYPTDLSEARRAEILASYDSWKAAHDAARRSAQCDEFEAAETEAAARENEARRALLFAPAHTMDGLLLKARAAIAQWGGAEDGIEGVQRKLKEAIEDGDATDEAALAVLLDLVNLSTSHPAPASKPLDFVEFPAGRYPASPSREVIETYRTFLQLELNYLNHEIYGKHAGRMHLWHDNPAALLHGPGEPEASSRAASVLGLLGLMPVPGRDGRAQAAALAHAAASAA